MSEYSLNSVAVFCGSSPGHDPDHILVATELGQTIARRGHRLVYGGGGLGLMGAVARAAKEEGGDVLGIIPDALRAVEGTLPGITHVFVDNMGERKQQMYDAADAYIVLPGGIGTLEEAIEVLSWQHLNIHEKPILFLSVNGYWDALIAEFDRIIGAGFASPDFAKNVLRAETVAECFEVIEERLENPIEREPLDQRIQKIAP